MTWYYSVMHTLQVNHLCRQQYCGTNPSHCIDPKGGFWFYKNFSSELVKEQKEKVCFSQHYKDTISRYFNFNAKFLEASWNLKGGFNPSIYPPLIAHYTCRGDLNDSTCPHWYSSDATLRTLNFKYHFNIIVPTKTR